MEKTTGQEYIGDYKNGLMYGKELYEWNEGEFYRGDFVTYIDPFVNGRPHGISIYGNGTNFQGEMEFIDGKMNINYMKRKIIK